MMLTPALVGVMPVSRKPAAAKRDTHSSRVRPCPPGEISMATSMNFSAAPSLGGAMIHSMTTSVPVGVHEDMLQGVGTPPSREGLEEAPRDDLAAIGHPGGLQHRPCRGKDVRLVEEHPAGPQVVGEQRREEAALAPAHVHHTAETPEVVRRPCRAGFEAGTAGHRSVEARRGLGVARPIFPRAHPVDVAKGALPVWTLCRRSPHACQ